MLEIVDRKSRTPAIHSGNRNYLQLPQKDICMSETLAKQLHNHLLGSSLRSGPLPMEPTATVRKLSALFAQDVMTLIQDYANEEISLSRLAELLGVNVADVQFLHPLCPPIYRRADLDDRSWLEQDNDGTIWDCECGTNITGPSSAPQCPHCGKPKMVRRSGHRSL